MDETFDMIVRRPPEAVFDALTDLEALAKASGGKVGASEVPGRPAKGPGSAVTLKTQMMPGVSDVLVEMLEFERPRRAVRKFHIPGLPATVHLDFEPVPEGTKVVLRVQLVAESFVYKMMLPVLAQKVKAEKAKALEHVKGRLESA